MQRRTKKLLGFNIDTFTFGEAVDYAKNLIDENKGGHIVTINPEIIELAQKNFEYANTIQSADLVIVDGIGIKLGFKIKGENVEKITGIDFASKLLMLANENAYSVALIGAKPEVNEKAKENLLKKYADLKIVYNKDGYFNNEEEDRVVEELINTNPKIVLVALGALKQDEFITKVRKLSPNILMIGVGGSFDVFSGMVKRAPEIWQKLNLEWLYRTLKEPQRFKRIFPTLPNFLIKVLLSKG